MKAALWQGSASVEEWPLGVECAWPHVLDHIPTNTINKQLAKGKAYWPAMLGVAALCFGLWQIGQGTYIHAKAWVAQVLIKQAWARTLDGETMVKPWPWADTWPVARIYAPHLGIERYVLAGASGRTIAFGPGHLFGTPLPGERGNSVIAAHRDTHFTFLRDLNVGDDIELQTSNGAIRRYRVEHTEVVDKRDISVLAQAKGETRLTLITCYPFDALRAGGPLRYVVSLGLAPALISNIKGVLATG